MPESEFRHGHSVDEHHMFWVNPNGSCDVVPTDVFYKLDEIALQKNPYPPTKSGPATKVSETEMRIYEIYR